MSKKITEFIGSNAFLSNMYEVPIEYMGIVFRSSENLYQSFKSNMPEEIKALAQLDPKLSKRYWRTSPIRNPEFFSKREHYMYIALREKFIQHPILAKMLLATKDAELLEGNWWGDLFWGVDHKTLEGQNVLGKLLMQIREELRNERF